jgi:hypothetical protein
VSGAAIGAATVVVGISTFSVSALLLPAGLQLLVILAEDVPAAANVFMLSNPARLRRKKTCSGLWRRLITMRALTRVVTADMRRLWLLVRSREMLLSKGGRTSPYCGR